MGEAAIEMHGMQNEGFSPDLGPTKTDEVRLDMNSEDDRNRKITNEALYSSRDVRRNECVKKCRLIAERLNSTEVFHHFDTLLRDKEFNDAIFDLFDEDSTGRLEQNALFEMLRVNTSGPRFGHTHRRERLEIVEMLENAAYMACGDDDLLPEDFRKILNGRNVRGKLFRLADTDGDGVLNIDEVIDCLVVLSKPRHTDNFSTEQIEMLEQLFRSKLPANQNHMTLKEFETIMPTRNAFFIKRVFEMFDIDGNGTISLAEFLDKMYSFAGAKRDTEKVMFLFRLYDVDGDGRLQEEEIERVMVECLKENRIELPESDTQDLATALYEEALGDTVDDGGINIDQLKDALSKHDGLLENLTNCLSSWMVPEKPKKKPSVVQKMWRKVSSTLSPKHIQSNWQLFAFFFFLIGVNIILFVHRATNFIGMRNLDGTFNAFYMLSRANGRVLLFNSTMILVVVLRYTITKMRDLGMSTIFPLDNNIFIHKVIGVLIFVQAWWHTIMHLINFNVNVQPDPVRYVQMNNDYWSPLSAGTPEWQHLGYNLPPGCDLVACSSANETTLSVDGVDFCQVCAGETWSYYDWIGTVKPGVFGLIGGIANPTGVALIVILSVMVICSMPFVRRSGYFQVFYYTHLLYYSYMTLLILHAPEFWKWVIAPLVIFCVEKFYRALSTFVGYGRSTIVRGDVLPSRVTALTIKRPDGFKYSTGDWLFVRIPKIATYEWHPFTISSAPENREYVTLHIRGVGQWTNRLYEFYETRKKAESLQKKKASIYRRSRRRTERGRPEKEERVKKDAIVGTEREKFGKIASNVVGFDESLALKKENQVDIHLDGPFGAPASNIFRAEHAVLIATGIGVTPSSSILQSLMYRYLSTKRECVGCNKRWTEGLRAVMQSLRKVDFFWINRDQKSFEWFLNLLNVIEDEQVKDEQSGDNFLDLHLYFTAALQSSDMRAVGLQLAMDLLHKKSRGKDVMTGLRSRTIAGRPNWDRVFQKIQNEQKGRVTVFYCGNPVLAKVLRAKCEDFGFDFRKEVF